MPCTSPLQGFFDGPNGQFKYSVAANEAFKAGKPLLGSGAVPCGSCISCRLKRSREWAIRCSHEASLYEENCFVTLTFDPKSLVELCPRPVWQSPFNDFSIESEKEPVFEGYSIVKSHMQDFMKRLRFKFSDRVIRGLYCGEYGEPTVKNGFIARPHYHVVLFNCGFPDKVLYKFSDGFSYYNSEILSSLWPFGHAVVADFCFNTAAYVSRYCLKKVNGKTKDMHYKGRVPEFSEASRMPGLGTEWFRKYWRDLYPSDQCVVNVDGDSVVFRPPRFYDKCLEKLDPVLMESVKVKRREFVDDLSSDNSFDRLLVKQRCVELNLKSMVRKLEVSCV